MGGRRKPVSFFDVIPAKAGIQGAECKCVNGQKAFCVYILASARNGTLYVGVTSELVKRVWQHRNEEADGFTKQYHVHTLVWFEQHTNAEAAITREKQIKEWKRKWKLELIEKDNPTWRDLYEEIAQ